MQPRARSVRVVMAGVALAAAGSARAETSPYSLGVYQSVSYQPNVFQAPNGQDRTSDLISGTGVNFGLTTAPEAVRLYVNGNVQANIYQDTKSLNNQSYGLSAGVDAKGERFGATLRVAASQSLGNYGTPGVAPTTEKNLQTNQDVGVAAQYRLAPRTSVAGGVGYQSLGYSAANFAAQENSSGVAFLELTHRLNPEFTAGGGLRYASGRTPNYPQTTAPGGVAVDTFNGRYLDLLAAWRAGPSNTLNARLSLSRVEHSLATQLDYSGLTGLISWTYSSNNLLITASLTQNTGAGPSLAGPLQLTASPVAAGTGSPPAASGNPPTGTDAGVPPSGNEPEAAATTPTADNNRLNTTLGLTASYRLSRTLTVSGNLSLNNAGLVNASNASGNAWTTQFGLGIGYVPTRSLSLNCNVNFMFQNANQSAEASDLATSFKSPSIGCVGTFAFF